MPFFQRDNRGGRMSKVHMIGIGGVGMSAVARLLYSQGMQVDGCDSRESRITRELILEGILVTIGHDPAHVKDADWVVYSTAVRAEHPELVAARDGKKKVIHRSEALAWVMDQYTTSIGVTGTHGKGTVSAMITKILDIAGYSPSFAIGAYLLDYNTNAMHRSRDWIVAEVDESDGSLLRTTPKIAVINNVEADHLNYYKDFDQVVTTIAEFIGANPVLDMAFVRADDKGAMKAARLSNRPVITFGFTDEADWVGECIGYDNSGSVFKIRSKGVDYGEFRINLPGRHNCENALAAAVVALNLDVDMALVKAGLREFKGLENRFGVTQVGNRWFVKDYISHPTGIKKVLEAAKTFEPKRIIAVFKPYRYTMINYLKDEYARAFDHADITFITEMWDAGEEPIEGVGSELIVNKLRQRGKNAVFSGDLKETEERLLDVIADGDMVVFLGGPDLFEVADQLQKRLENED